MLDDYDRGHLVGSGDLRHCLNDHAQGQIECDDAATSLGADRIGYRGRRDGDLPCLNLPSADGSVLNAPF